MKKAIIASYFVGMLLLTFLTAKAVAVYKSGKQEVIFREHQHELTDTEIAQRHIEPREGKNVVEKWKTKETRTKTLFGWDTQIDYVEQPATYYVDCGCH